MAAFDPRPGTRLGDWVLLRPGGVGEGDESWIAQDGSGALGVAYLLRSARGVELGRLAALRHPALVELVGVGERPVPFLVREMIGGKPLSAYMMSGAAPENLAVSIGAQVASGLAALHAEGLCHGLLADSRVLVESIREPRVLLVGQGLASDRWQGGLDHAAPESVRGAVSQPSADVYALGLVLWQLAHGRLPWAEHGRSQALLRRGREQPRARAGSPPLRALMEACLSLDPAARPSALEAVRSLEGLGGRLTAPDSLHLRRRARSITVLEPRVRRQLDRWLDEGGRLAILGPSGSGRTRLLDALSTALRVRGMPYARVGSGGHPWDAIEHALTCPGLPGVPVPLPTWVPGSARAQVAAQALAGRAPGGFHLLVDDFDLLDQPSQECLASLANEERVRICVSTRRAPSWAQQACELSPWRREQVLQLLRGVLGEVEGQEELAAQLWTVAGGVPGPTIQRLFALVQAGALRWDVLSWRVVAARVPRAMQDTTVPDDPLGGLGPVARQLGSFLALVGAPCTVEYLCHLAGVEEEEGRVCARELIHGGLARVEHRQVLPRNAEALEDLRRACCDPRAVHRRLLEQQLDLADSAGARLAWYLLGAGDAEAVAAHGGAAVELASLREPGDGARLAEGLWQIEPCGALAVPRMRALARAGREEEALDFGRRVFDDPANDADPVQVAATMAWIHARLPDHAPQAFDWIRRCRAMPGDPPEALAEVEARLHLAAGELPAAMQAARVVADREAPEEDAERLDRWITLRALWARALHRAGSLDLAIGVLEPIPRQLAQDRPSRAALDGLLGSLLLEAGRFAEAAAAMELALGRELGLPPVAQARLRRDIGTAQRVLGNRELALQAWRESLLILERVGSSELALEVLERMALCLRELARPEEAEAAGRLGYRRAVDASDDSAASRAALGLVALFVDRGELDEAERWQQRAKQSSGDDPEPWQAARLARWQAELALHRRDAAAIPLLEAAVTHARLAGMAGLSGVLRALVCFARVRQGVNVDLDGEMARILEPLRHAGGGEDLAEARLWLAEALHAGGRPEDTEREASRVLVFAEEVGHRRLRERARQLITRVGRPQREEPEVTQLGQLIELAVAVVREKDTDSLLRRIAASARDLLDAERAFVLLGAEGTMEVVASSSRDGLDPGRPSTSVVHRALREGKEVIAADISERSDLRDAISVLTLDLGSAMCVPMIEADQTLGVIYVDSRRSSTVEPATAVRLLRALAGYAAVAVSNVERLAQVSRRAEEAAEIAHDLRSPAASISILAGELMQALPHGHAGRERVERIMLASRRIQDMASAMLEAESLHLQTLDLSSLVARAVALEEPAARQAGVSLQLELEPGLEVEGDALALSRVLSNLLGNALRYSPRGGVVSVHLATAGVDACCRVRDRGPGIPSGSEESIFQRGIQAGDRVGGRGLGLAIARRIVEQHGGRIEARSPGDRGAEVFFVLPVAR